MNAGDFQKVVSDVIASLEVVASSDRVLFMAKNCPTQLKVLGVTNPNIKKITKELKKLTSEYSPAESLHLMKALIATQVFECQQLAYDCLGNDKQCLAQLTAKDIDELGVSLDNWALVDYFAVIIVGYAWREKIIDIQKIKKYLQSADVWIRRVGVVATVGLNQKARGAAGDPKQTLEICQLVVDDHADMINKALSWALRELSKRDKQSVVDFMEQYKERLNGRVLREVTNKLEKGTKN